MTRLFAVLVLILSVVVIVSTAQQYTTFPTPTSFPPQPSTAPLPTPPITFSPQPNTFSPTGPPPPAGPIMYSLAVTYLFTKTCEDSQCSKSCVEVPVVSRSGNVFDNCVTSPDNQTSTAYYSTDLDHTLRSTFFLQHFNTPTCLGPSTLNTTVSNVCYPSSGGGSAMIHYGKYPALLPPPLFVPIYQPLLDITILDCVDEACNSCARRQLTHGTSSIAACSTDYVTSTMNYRSVDGTTLIMLNYNGSRCYGFTIGGEEMQSGVCYPNGRGGSVVATYSPQHPTTMPWSTEPSPSTASSTFPSYGPSSWPTSLTTAPLLTLPQTDTPQPTSFTSAPSGDLDVYSLNVGLLSTMTCADKTCSASCTPTPLVAANASAFYNCVTSDDNVTSTAFYTALKGKTVTLLHFNSPYCTGPSTRSTTELGRCIPNQNGGSTMLGVTPFPQQLPPPRVVQLSNPVEDVSIYDCFDAFCGTCSRRRRRLSTNPNAVLNCVTSWDSATSTLNFGITTDGSNTLVMLQYNGSACSGFINGDSFPMQSGNCYSTGNGKSTYVIFKGEPMMQPTTSPVRVPTTAPQPVPPTTSPVHVPTTAPQPVPPTTSPATAQRASHSHQSGATSPDDTPTTNEAEAHATINNTNVVMIFAGIIICVLLIGFVAGWLVFKRKATVNADSRDDEVKKTIYVQDSKEVPFV